MDNDEFNKLSTVRRNLLTVPEYTPYCGNDISRTAPGGCHNPRTKFDRKLGQFVCPRCGFTTDFEKEIIDAYVTMLYAYNDPEDPFFNKI
jgi:predicted RNA-binding Zn-ribbon protein involved in translation (DUF1610 family)